MLQVSNYFRTMQCFLSHPVEWLKSHPLLVSGALFFVSTTLVNLGNYVFNLIFGRWLGPVIFADLSLIVTLMLVTTFATTAFTTATAKFASTYTVGSDPSRMTALRSWLSHRALAVGLLLFLCLALGSPFLTTIFHMHSPWPFVILGLPLFFMLAIDRGILQGQARFGRLAASNQAEMWARLLGAIAFVALGWSVAGATWGLTLSFVAAWLVALSAGKGLPKQFQPLSPADKTKIIHYFGPVIWGLIVKSFFPAAQAGFYASLALIGRMVFFATWSVVMVMFPLVSQKHHLGEAHRFLLWTSMGIIALVSTIIICGAFLLPNLVVNILFGSAYLSIAPLLWLYALATAFYALANVIVNYYLSLGNGRGSYLVLLAGIAQVVGLLIWHQSLFIVVFVQVCIMAGLLLILMLWDWFILRPQV